MEFRVKKVNSFIKKKTEFCNNKCCTVHIGDRCRFLIYKIDKHSYRLEVNDFFDVHIIWDAVMGILENREDLLRYILILNSSILGQTTYFRV